MKLGLYRRHTFTGSEIYVFVQQAAALLIAPFMLKHSVMAQKKALKEKKA